MRVYHLEDDGHGLSWKQLGQDIDGEAADDKSGRSVSLSGDGRILAIGANRNAGNSNNSGRVRVYHYLSSHRHVPYLDWQPPL